LTLFAPNRFIKDFVAEKYVERIAELVRELQPDEAVQVALEIGASHSVATQRAVTRITTTPANDVPRALHTDARLLQAKKSPQKRAKKPLSSN